MLKDVLKNVVSKVIKEKGETVHTICVKVSEKYDIQSVYVTYGKYSIRQVELTFASGKVHSVNGEVNMYVIERINIELATELKQ